MLSSKINVSSIFFSPRGTFCVPPGHKQSCNWYMLCIEVSSGHLQIKPKSFPQISTNFPLSTFEYKSFSSSAFALLCGLCQKKTLKDPFLKPLNVLSKVLKPPSNVAPLTNFVCCGSLVKGLSLWGLDFLKLRLDSQGPAQECKT